MQSFDQGILDAYARGRLAVRYLLRCNVDEGAVGFWNGIGAISVDGQSYAGSGTVGEVGDAPTNSALQPQAMTFSMSALESAPLQLAFNYTYKGRVAEFSRMLVDTVSGAIIGSHCLFRGEMDQLTFRGGGRDGRSELALDVESFTRVVTRSNPATRSDAYQKRRAADDKFFQYVGVADRTEYWGQQPDSNT